MPEDLGSLTVQASNPNTSGVQVSLTGNGLANPATATLEQGQCSIPGLPLGTYSATASGARYETVREQVEVTRSGSVWQPMLVSTDSGSLGTPSSAPPPFGAALTSGSALPQPPPVDPYEGIYSNASYEDYYTSAQCRVYVGNMFVDELQSIQFALQANVIPVYNYADPLVKAWGEGKQLVQGQLVLNFVSDLYLYTVLTEYQSRATQVGDPSSDQQDAGLLVSALASRGTAAGKDNPALNAAIATLLQNPNAVAMVKQTRQRRARLDQYRVNGCVYPGTCDLRIEIGTGSRKINRWIEGVKFFSNEQILDQSGNLIGDAYGFYARRLR